MGVPSLIVNAVWRISLTLFTKMHNDLVYDPYGCSPFFPQHNEVRNRLLSMVWEDTAGLSYCFSDMVLGWPRSLGDTVAYFCRLAAFYHRAALTGHCHEMTPGALLVNGVGHHFVWCVTALNVNFDF